MLRTRTCGDAAQLLVDEAEDWTGDEPAVGLRAAEDLAIDFVLWPPRAVAIAPATQDASESCSAPPVPDECGRPQPVAVGPVIHRALPRVSGVDIATRE